MVDLAANIVVRIFVTAVGLLVFFGVFVCLVGELCCSTYSSFEDQQRRRLIWAGGGTSNTSVRGQQQHGLHRANGQQTILTIVPPRSTDMVVSLPSPRSPAVLSTVAGRVSPRRNSSVFVFNNRLSPTANAAPSAVEIPSYEEAVAADQEEPPTYLEAISLSVFH